MKICVVSANLGGFDIEQQHVPQTVPCDFRHFNDENFPPRYNSMLPRLQAKIPKMFAWQLAPGYDIYLWLDGAFAMAKPDTVEFFVNELGDDDIVVFRHPVRPDVRQELRYTRKGVRQGRLYLHNRYKNELYQEMGDEIFADKDFKDDTLVNGGVFMFRNTPQVQQMFKEWWYFVSRYAVQDQIPFPYVLRKSGIRVKILERNLVKDFPYFNLSYHTKRKG
jgi:hypothetical protein